MTAHSVNWIISRSGNTTWEKNN